MVDPMSFVLCLDGGGVRGYSSLLILQQLMQEIDVLFEDEIKVEREPQHFYGPIPHTLEPSLDGDNVSTYTPEDMMHNQGEDEPWSSERRYRGRHLRMHPTVTAIAGEWRELGRPSNVVVSPTSRCCIESHTDAWCRDDEKSMFAVKNLSRHRHDSTYKTELDALKNFRREWSGCCDNTFFALIGKSEGRHTVREILCEAERTAANGDKEAAELLEDLSLVVEVSKRKGWRNHISNLTLSLGQLLAAVPVILYQPTHLTHGETSVDRRVPSTLAAFRKLVQKLVSTTLPPSLTTTINEPTPELFIVASLILGSLITVHYHYNSTSVYQKPLLLGGLSLGLLVGVFLCYRSDVAAIPVATTVIPTVTVVSLMLSHVVSAVRRSVFGKHDREMQLRRALAGVRSNSNASQRAGGEGFRFVVVE